MAGKVRKSHKGARIKRPKVVKFYASSWLCEIPNVGRLLGLVKPKLTRHSIYLITFLHTSRCSLHGESSVFPGWPHGLSQNLIPALERNEKQSQQCRDSNVLSGLLLSTTCLINMPEVNTRQKVRSGQQVTKLQTHLNAVETWRKNSNILAWYFKFYHLFQHIIIHFYHCATVFGCSALLHNVSTFDFNDANMTGKPVLMWLNINHRHFHQKCALNIFLFTGKQHICTSWTYIRSQVDHRPQ